LKWLELTDGGGVVGLDAIDVVFVAGDSGEGGAITDHGDKGHMLVQVNILPIDTGLDVNHKRLLVLLRHHFESLVDCLHLSTAVLSHHHVGFGLSSLQNLPLPFTHPRREPINQRLFREKLPVVGGESGQVKTLEESRHTVHYVHRVVAHLNGRVQNPSHGLASLGGGVLEPVQACLLVGKGTGYPNLEVIGVIVQLVYVKLLQSDGGFVYIIHSVT